MLFVARALLGIAVGFTSVTAPVYVSELAPPQSRGMLIGLYQFALTSGIALADLVGYWFAASQGWRWMFAFGLVPAVLFLFMVLTVPESPRWLFAQNRLAEAESVLKSYTDEAGARLLLEDIRVSLMTKMERRWSALWSPAVRGSLLIAAGFMVLIPATGINAILYYGPQIFSLAGIGSNKSAIFATLLVAITNVLATVIALVLVDRVGRKPLLYAGLGGMTVALFVLSFCFHQQAQPGAVAGQNRHSLPDVFHHLLRLQYWADRLDNRLRSFSLAGTGPRGCCRDTEFRHLKFSGFAYISVSPQSCRLLRSPSSSTGRFAS